jgi:glc operon protein GlcG
MRTRFALDRLDARAAVDAGIAAAAAKGWAVTVAVVDDSGTPIVVERMDEASPASFAVAIEKARSSALIGLPTKALEAMVGERPGLLTMPGRVAIEGGIPILHDGQRVGGIGVSGVRSHEDAEVATAALQAIATRPGA